MNLTLVDNCTSAEALMERVLRDGGPIAPEYPLVFDDRFAGKQVTLRDGDDVRSACAILSRDFLVEGTKLRGGLIGSVATHESSRGQGFGTRLLVQAEALLQLEGCGFALLWAQNPDFYLKRGYGPIGHEIDFGLAPELVDSLPTSEDVRLGTSEDAEAIHALYEQHGTRVIRSQEETRVLLGCPAMTILVVEREGTVVAYALMGRGRDLAGTVHEWSGAKDDVLALLRAHAERHFAAGDTPGSADANEEMLFFMAPAVQTEIIAELDRLGAPSREGMLGLGKILDRKEAARAINERLGTKGMVEVVEDGGLPFLFRGPDKVAQLDDEGVLALMLGVPDVHGDVASFLDALGVEEVNLPLAPFAWGLDSI